MTKQLLIAGLRIAPSGCRRQAIDAFLQPQRVSGLIFVATLGTPCMLPLIKVERVGGVVALRGTFCIVLSHGVHNLSHEVTSDNAFPHQLFLRPDMTATSQYSCGE